MGCSVASIRFSAAGRLLALLVASSLPVRPARAEVSRELQRAVHLTPGATCLEHDTLVEHIAARLGSSELDAALSIDVRGSPNFARFVEFHVTQAGRTRAERRFEPGPARCEDLHAALGLAIALTIKASLLETQREQRAAAASSRGERAWQLGADALVGMIVAPGAGYGGDLRVQRAFTRRIAGRFGALGMANPQRSFQDSAGSFDMWLVAGRADLCALLGAWARVGLGACIGFAAGGTYARGEALAPSTSASAGFFALDSALELALDVSPAWSLSLAGNALVPLERTSFVVRDGEGRVVAARELSVVGGFVSLGPTYNF